MFSIEIFRLRVPKIFVGEPFCAVFPKISRSEKVYGEEGRGGPRFSTRKFLSHNAEKLRMGTSHCCVSEFSR